MWDGSKNMLYKICNNGRAVLVTREPCFVENLLEIGFDGCDEGCTAIFTVGDKKYYRPIKDGTCSIEAAKLTGGAIKLVVIEDDATDPTYVCDELWVVHGGDGVYVSGNFLEYDKLLAEQRCEIDNLRADNAEFKKELATFREEFDRLYKGYQVI